MKTGLVSVTFRALSPEQIVALAAKANLDGIEWGGDIHVPHGQKERAKQVKALTEKAGLEVLSYGSYYRAGEGQDFAPVLASALALDAPVIRIWAGAKGSGEAEDAYRKRVAEESREACRAAAAHGVLVCYEYHDGTLTDTPESALKLLEEVGAENLRLYWQPKFNLPFEENARALKLVKPWVWNIHAFAWDAEYRRYPLDRAETQWREYMKSFGKAKAIMLEFVAEDDPEQMIRDAEALKKWLTEMQEA